MIASLTLFGVITAVGRVFDAVTDPMVASWSDRAAFKGGRRIPFMKAVAVPFALCTVGVFFLPQTASVTANNTIIFVLLMLFYLFMTIYCTPYNALIAELGDTQKNRINVSTYISFTYIAGFSLATLIPSLAGPLEGVAGSQEGAIRLAIGIMSAVACAALLVPALFIKEREYIDSEPVKTPAFTSLVRTFTNGQFRRFVYADVIYFFAVTLFQTGLADFETQLMGIDSSNTFTLTVLMTVISLSLYPAVNKLAPRKKKKKHVFRREDLCHEDGPGDLHGGLYFGHGIKDGRRRHGLRHRLPVPHRRRHRLRCLPDRRDPVFVLRGEEDPLEHRAAQGRALKRRKEPCSLKGSIWISPDRRATRWFSPRRARPTACAGI